MRLPGKPAAYNCGLLWLIDGLLYGIVAYSFRLLGIPGTSAQDWVTLWYASTPQLPFKRPQIPSYRDHKALNRATLGGLGSSLCFWVTWLSRYGFRDPSM